MPKYAKYALKLRIFSINFVIILYMFGKMQA